MALTLRICGNLRNLQIRLYDHCWKIRVAPRDKHGNAKPLNEWGLKNYIDVAHELKWVSESAKDAGDVLRDYRNYVHPTKQISHNVHLVQDDAVLLWEIGKAVTRQLLKTTKS